MTSSTVLISPQDLIAWVKQASVHFMQRIQSIVVPMILPSS